MLKTEADTALESNRTTVMKSSLASTYRKVLLKSPQQIGLSVMFL